MSDNEKDSPAAPESGDDRIANLQKEFTRKIGNVETQLKSSNEQLLAQLQNMLAPKAPKASESSSEELETLMYTKPAEAIRRIKDEAKKEIMEAVDGREQANLKRNTVINSLYKDFPELAVDDSDLTKLALTKFNEISKEGGNNPSSYRAAVAEAALELGMKPKSKRPADEDDFSLSGSNSARGRGGRPKSDELHPATNEIAKLMGVDPAKVKARVNKRNNYGKWE